MSKQPSPLPRAHSETILSWAALPERVRDVSICVMTGMTNAEIAVELRISLKSVEKCITEMHTRIGARNSRHLWVLLGAAFKGSLGEEIQNA